MTGHYSNEYYASRRDLTRASASEIMRLLYPALKPMSVIDLGCGTGIWLAACKQLGATSVLGLDGDWVAREMLEIDAREFRVHDFNAAPYTPERRYDLALSIEVAEHLSGEMGMALVDALTAASDVVLFSAAVRGQGGAGHVNEQPQHFWAAQFAARDYLCVDFVRPRIWEHEEVNLIYKQNMLLYMRTATYNDLRLTGEVISLPYALDRVHPDLLAMRVHEREGGRLLDLRRGLGLIARGLGIKRPHG